MSLTIAAISDTHGRHHELDLSQYPADVLVHAGDWTGGRDLGLSETQDFLDWFSQQPYNHLICIAGNHELQVEASEEQFRELLLMYPNITYLQDSGVTIDNINFYGSPYSNKFYDWAFMEEEFYLRYRWDKIPDDTNVLITHGPAYGCLDVVERNYGVDPHVGSKSLHYRKLALQDSLKLHISGHIHESYGQQPSEKFTSICASILDEKYRLTNKPIIKEI